MRFLILFAFAVGFGVSGASAQSFDCDDARLDAEFAICDSSRLSCLDEDMSALYYDLPNAVREEIKGSQLRWLRRRNACGYDRRCIARAYRRRIDFLSQF